MSTTDELAGMTERIDGVAANGVSHRTNPFLDASAGSATSEPMRRDHDLREATSLEDRALAARRLAANGVVVAIEAEPGALPVDPNNDQRSGRLQPGRSGQRPVDGSQRDPLKNLAPEVRSSTRRHPPIAGAATLAILLAGLALLTFVNHSGPSVSRGQADRMATLARGMGDSKQTIGALTRQRDNAKQALLRRTAELEAARRQLTRWRTIARRRSQTRRARTRPRRSGHRPRSRPPRVEAPHTRVSPVPRPPSRAAAVTAKAPVVRQAPAPTGADESPPSQSDGPVPAPAGPGPEFP
jgi:hypothetical protein